MNRKASFLCLTAMFLSGMSLPAKLTVQTTIKDPGNEHAAYHDLIRSNLQAAADQWGQYLADDASFEITVRIVGEGETTYGTANGGSDEIEAIGKNGRATVYQEGMAYELSTGNDPNGSGSDATITIDKTYLVDELWFDPSPASRSTFKPENRSDAISILVHELGHCLAWNGWGSYEDNDYDSVFDSFLVQRGKYEYFTGYQATAIYKSAAPISSSHLGDNEPHPGSELYTTVMFGGYGIRERQYITPLDLAILNDTGLPLTPAGKFLLANAGGYETPPWEARGLSYRWLGYFNTAQWPWIRHELLDWAMVEGAGSNGRTSFRLWNSKVTRLQTSRSNWPWVWAESKNPALPKKGWLEIKVTNGIRYFKPKGGKAWVRDRKV